MGDFNLSKVPTSELKAELENRPDYCWFQGEEVRTRGRTCHLCHCADEPSAHCEQNGGIGRCMTQIRAWNKKHAATGGTG